MKHPWNHNWIAVLALVVVFIPAWQHLSQRREKSREAFLNSAQVGVQDSSQEAHSTNCELDDLECLELQHQEEEITHNFDRWFPPLEWV
jgi:hypothetical protein